MKNPFAQRVQPPKEEPNDSIASVETIDRLDWDRAYPQGLERVWSAISSAEEISAWMKFPTELEPQGGRKNSHCIFCGRFAGRDCLRVRTAESVDLYVGRFAGELEAGRRRGRDKAAFFSRGSSSRVSWRDWALGGTPFWINCRIIWRGPRGRIGTRT